VQRRAFSLIELIVVIGIVMVLVGLIAPSLGKARYQAKGIKWAQQVRSNAVLVTMYTAGQKDVFPIADEMLDRNIDRWSLALKQAGLIEKLEEIDPEEIKNWGAPAYMLNMAAYNDHRQMVLGQTERMSNAKCEAVRLGDIQFPSSLGMMYKMIANGDTSVQWCCLSHASWRGPVAFMDESVVLGAWPDFVAVDQLIIENQVGYPVGATWEGSRGRDRREMSR